MLFYERNVIVVDIRFMLAAGIKYNLCTLNYLILNGTENQRLIRVASSTCSLPLPVAHPAAADLLVLATSRLWCAANFVSIKACSSRLRLCTSVLHDAPDA